MRVEGETLVAAWLFVGLLLLMVGIGYTIRGLNVAIVYQKEHPLKCLTGAFLVPNEEWQATVSFGEQQLCGRDLQWSGVYGPSIEEWRKGQLPLIPPEAKKQ